MTTVSKPVAVDVLSGIQKVIHLINPDIDRCSVVQLTQPIDAECASKESLMADYPTPLEVLSLLSQLQHPCCVVIARPEIWWI